MNRIYRLNITGISTAAAALIASGALAVGCGPSPALRTAPFQGGSANTYPVNPGSLPQNAQNIEDLNAFSQQQQAQITALFGTYGGSFRAYDSNYSIKNQAYRLTLTKGASSSSPGKSFVQINFDAGVFSFSSLVRTTFTATTWGGTGPTYTFVTLAQNATAFDSSGPVYLVLELTLDAANRFDPTQSAGNNHGLGPIRIVDGWTLDSAVELFYDDFQRL